MEISRKNGGGDKRLIDQRSKIGAVWPMGVSIAQSWFELGALTWLIGKYKIKSFVEIGIMQGGLSAQLFGWTLELYKSILRDGDLIAAHDLGHEFEIEDLHTEGLKRIESEWLIDTHIAAFQNKRF
jgi:hypothetical protein